MNKSLCNKFVWISLFIIGFTINTFCETAISHQKRETNSCGKYEWKCADGDCISIYEVCDGIYNCKDESDETVSSCYNERCPSYTFRCTYGACVNGNSECNGQQDCVDNSDELSLNCPGVKQSLLLKGNCSDYQFQCDNGECIQEYSLCDGATDCKDASDETVKRCSNIFCPSFGFRCGYGGCVSGTAKCDGNNDCADGSDEENLLCNYKTKPITPVIPTTVGGACRIMELPLHGKASYEGQLNTQFKIGEAIEEFSTIVYRCDSKFLLSGGDTNFCIGGMWSNKVPSCKKYCSNIPLFAVTIKAECELNGMPISCEQKLLPGTIARLRCKNGYRKPNTAINDLLRCDSDGQWDYSPFRCEQICGIDGSESGVQYIVGGEKTNNTKVPWHVGIYSSIGKHNQFTQICGGTILNAKVIITAAHCFWDQSNEKFHDKKYFKVAVGKYYRDYYADEPLKTQSFTIDQFFNIQGYNDATDRFNNDIALLVLDKYIEFRSHITPICIDWNLSYNERYVPADWRGRVAGWGLEQSGGEPSPELKVIELPTVDYNTCKHDSTPEFRPYITGDKFCAGYTDAGLSVCQGDSGGGLVFPKNFEGEEQKYFLRGLVSTGANKAGSCDNNKYATFTNIQYHIAFIGNIESEFRAK